MYTIDESVGKNAVNKPVDVIKIQDLIDNNDLYTGLISPLSVTGLADDPLVTAISNFQTNHPLLKMKKPDGVVSPNGKTLKKLHEYSNKLNVHGNYLPIGFNGNTFVRFNIDTFIALYELQYPSPKVGADAKAGLTKLLNYLIADTDVTDIRWAAYMLATVKLECGNKWQPIEEYGKGATHTTPGDDYGIAIKIPDPSDNTGKKFLSNIYYGRGYVQLTWDHRYKKMDTAFGLSGAASLYLYPSNALNPDTAYKIMSYGMRNGSFTGKKLSDYITGGGLPDYKNARRIINGVDQAGTIKNYAKNIEFLLRFCNGV